VAKTEMLIELYAYSADTRNTNVGEVAAAARRYRFSVHRKKCLAKEMIK
jgi:chorismate-pyruvate lyase